LAATKESKSCWKVVTSSEQSTGGSPQLKSCLNWTRISFWKRSQLLSHTLGLPAYREPAQTETTFQPVTSAACFVLGSRTG